MNPESSNYLYDNILSSILLYRSIRVPLAVCAPCRAVRATPPVSAGPPPDAHAPPPETQHGQVKRSGGGQLTNV